MNSLSDLNILPVMDTSTYDLSIEFFTPMLSNSIRYDRGVGYFSSGWLRINIGDTQCNFAYLQRFDHIDEAHLQPIE